MTYTWQDNLLHITDNGRLMEVVFLHELINMIKDNPKVIDCKVELEEN